jgi:hypothetical protein
MDINALRAKLQRSKNKFYFVLNPIGSNSTQGVEQDFNPLGLKIPTAYFGRNYYFCSIKSNKLKSNEVFNVGELYILCDLSVNVFLII